MIELARTFWNDGKVEALVILIVLDFLLGVIAALKLGTFRLSYIADFLRKDVVFKMGGYLILYAGALFAGEADIIIDGLDLGVIAGAGYIVIVGAMVGSILNSIRDLGFIPGTDPPPPVEHSPVEMLAGDEGI